MLLMFLKMHLLSFFRHTRNLQYDALGLREPPYNKLSDDILKAGVYTHLLSLYCRAEGDDELTASTQRCALCVWARQTGAEYLNQRPTMLTGHCKSTSCSYECVVG